MTIYRTTRLHLRPSRKQDATELFRAINNEEIVRNLTSAPWPYSLADAELLAGRDFNPKEPRLSIFLGDVGPEELIGIVGLDRMPDGDVELGYWIAKEHWGRGYAPEAARLMIHIAGTQLRLPRLVAGYFVDNPASGRVLKKLGFVPAPGLIDRHSRARGCVAECQMCILDLRIEGATTP
jgi:RimJ/RimL family protein N-acetyltransferase